MHPQKKPPYYFRNFTEMDWAGEGENVEANSVTEKKQLFFWVD